MNALWQKVNREMVAKYAPRLKDATPIGNPADTGAGR